MDHTVAEELFRAVKGLVRAWTVHEFRPAEKGWRCGICREGRRSPNHPGPNETCRTVKAEAYRLGHEVLLAAQRKRDKQDIIEAAKQEAA